MIRPGKEYKSLISEAAIPWLSDSSRCEDLSAVDGSALTEMLVDKIIIERYPSKIDKDGRRHYLIRDIPYQDPKQDAERSRRCMRLGSSQTASLTDVQFRFIPDWVPVAA